MRHAGPVTPVVHARNVTGHVSFGWVDAQLRAARSIWLATGRPDGRPHVTPVWFLWDGRAVRFSIAPEAVKAANLARLSYVELHLGDADDAIVLRGHARRVTDEGELAELAAGWAAKYVDPSSGALAELGALRYRVDVERIFAWMYGTCADRTDWWGGRLPAPARVLTDA